MSNRSVPMGIGISPILFVITFDWCLRSQQIQNPHLEYKAYADDLSFYFNLSGFRTLISRLKLSKLWLLKELLYGRNILISALNSPSLFHHAGLRFCPQKSGLVRFLGLWLKPFKSLGLQLYTDVSPWSQIPYLLSMISLPLNLMGYTRGRAANPLSGKSATPASRVLLNFRKSVTSLPLTYSLMVKSFRKYFGLLMSKLYSSKEVEPNFSVNSDAHSYLWLITKNRPRNKKLRTNHIHLDLYNSGSEINRLFLSVNKYNHLDDKWNRVCPNLERSLRQNWHLTSVAYPSIVSDGLIPNLPPDYGYFSKYSELNLSPEELSNLKASYENHKLP